MNQENIHQTDMDSIIVTTVKEIERMRDSRKALPLVQYAEAQLRDLDRIANQWGVKIPENVRRYVRRISAEYQLRVSLELADETKENPDQSCMWIDKAHTYAKELGTTLGKIDRLLDIAY